MTSKLLKKTLELLDATEIPLEKIAQSTKLTYAWLTSVKYGKIKNPSVEKIECLYVFLAQRDLFE